MKCVARIEIGEEEHGDYIMDLLIIRVPDEIAEYLVNHQAYQYAKKEDWKLQGREYKPIHLDFKVEPNHPIIDRIKLYLKEANS